MKKLFWFLIIIAFLVLTWSVAGSSIISPISQNTQISLITPTPSVFTFAKVTRVFDGDTIQIETGEKVRYIGMDTPEVYPSIQCYSEEAKKKNEELVLGKTVKLEKDISETDKYGRLLRYIFIGDQMINDDLVKSGSARVETVPPDIKYKQEFADSEKYAKENKLGLWGECF